MTDIQAGDVVVCIQNEWAPPRPYHPKRGDVLRVSAVVFGEYLVGGMGRALKFVGKRSDCGWNESGFRKIKPATKKFTSQIKAIRPIRETA